MSGMGETPETGAADWQIRPRGDAVLELAGRLRVWTLEPSIARNQLDDSDTTFQHAIFALALALALEPSPPLLLCLSA